VPGAVSVPGDGGALVVARVGSLLRQVAASTDAKVARFEEFHNVVRLAAFCCLSLVWA
jgi:hypothetical protein